MRRIIVVLIAVASLAAACAQTGAGTVSEADRCSQTGGVWRPILGACDRSAGGGGGY
jgi:hypothetical protein